MDKGVSPTQATSLNVPPPIDALAGLTENSLNSIDNGLLAGDGSLNFDFLSGSDDELDSLILDDLVLANLLGKRRMDEGLDDDYQDSQWAPDVIDVTMSPISKRLPSSVAAPVQTQPKRRPKRRRKKDRKRKKSSRRRNEVGGGSGGGGGGGSMCQLFGICDNVPSATNENPIRSQHSPQSDVPFASSQVDSFYIEAPKEKRLGEKTAAEIAQLFSQPDASFEGDDNDEPMRSEDMEDSQFAASSRTNYLSIVAHPQPLQHSYQQPPERQNRPYEMPSAAEINFSEGKHIDVTDADDIPETYRMTHFGQDVSNLEQGSYSNVPIASINFEDYKDRESRMVPSESKDSVVVQQPPDLVPSRRPDQKSKNLKPQPKKSDLLLEEKSDFNLEDYNMDREAKTWRPLRLNKSGEVERTDVSEPIVETLTASDWVPKLGPDFKVRET